MIRFEQASRTYRTPPGPGRRAGVVHALREVSLEVPRGESCAVVGPNGAGKTTLLALLLGFLRPTAGRCEVAGGDPRATLRRKGASYLPDRFSLPRGWRVRPGLRALARLEGMGARAATARVDAVMERFGLDELADRPVARLSRGQLQRVGLAQALLAARDLVVLDEPTTGLDPVWRMRLRDLLGELGAEGRTIVLASHDLAEVERVADRVVVLVDGRVSDVVHARSPARSADWRLDLAEPFPGLDRIFPGAEPLEAERVWRVRASGPGELSERLAALLAADGVVAGIRPLEQGLEARVRDVLDPEGQP